MAESRRGRGAGLRSNRPRVVVVGAGFAGLATVSRLTRAGLRVTLVDRNVYSTFQPLLYQVMAGREELSASAERREVAVTVVGGGATGVELAGTLAELRSIAVPATFPEIDPARVHIRLVEQAAALLAPFHPSLRAYALRQLRDRGVDVQLGTAISEITTDRVLLADGRELHSDLTVWAAGVTAPDTAGHWNLPQGRGGRIVTGPDLRVTGHDRIFAVGDIALTEGHPLPQLAQPGLQIGRHAAEQVRRLASGLQTVPFAYHDKGIMATI